MVLSRDVSRSELAGWDASVRAWLQSADAATYNHHGKFTLIVTNVDLPAPCGSSM